MASPKSELECLRILATIQLLAAELRSKSGIRIIQPHLNAQHVGQIQIDLDRLGEALQQLLGPFISQKSTTDGGLSSTPVPAAYRS